MSPEKQVSQRRFVDPNKANYCDGGVKPEGELSGCNYGKRLPSALYIFRPTEIDVPRKLWQTIQRAELASNPDPSWNLLKLHTDQFAITFLSYPDFDHDPHPALTRATKINLKTGSIITTDYRQRPNPPILHRKETFLTPEDPRVPIYAALTKSEEDAGLYRDSSRIGLRLHWASLLSGLKLSYDGHTLVRCRNEDGAYSPPAEKHEIARHRTAIKRYDLSKPVKQLLERELLRKGDSFFDFGCGHGMDIEALRNLGYEADGWDPAFRPNTKKIPADVVNLGYVLNVIEEPEERIQTLREAFTLTRRLLLVSTMAVGQESSAHSRHYRDGYITKTNTFQKFFAPGELEELISLALNAEASTLALGLCVIFKNEDDAELFEASRNRRRIDWTEISTQLRFSKPRIRERRAADRYELHRELFDDFWKTMIELGRSPEPNECLQLGAVRQAAGGLKRAIDLVVGRNGERLWQESQRMRREEVLVYLAMTKFRKRFLRREIPLRTRNDIRSFFGDLATAQARAGELLFASGDSGEIELACEGLKLGWQDEDALIIHRSLLPLLPPILRIYVHCAAFRYGDPAQADLIKIHKRSGKLTFQHFDDFDGSHLPVLQTRIKVNLRTLFVEVFDHTITATTQQLYFKERFVAKDYPGRPKMERFSAKLRKIGLNEATIGFGPDKQTFERFCASKGLTPKLTPIARGGEAITARSE